jgi:hypothetical protein
MTGVLFLSQASLDQWLEGGQADLGHDTLTFTADKSSVPLVNAVHLTKVVDGPDGAKLLGKVKAVEALRMGGADISLGTVVMADTTYEVTEGYMVTVQLPERPGARPPSRPVQKANGQEADLLAQFILNKLS